MAKREADILQIRKYLNGELNAKAMHQLERRAQDDPFLMDALEGYGDAKGNQDTNLNEISARLKQRIAHNQRRIIPWKYFAVAASVLIILTVGGIFLRNHQPENKRVMAAIVKQADELPATDQKKPESDSEKKNKIAASATQPDYLKKLSASNNADVSERPPVVRETVAAAPDGNSNPRMDTVVKKEMASSVAAVTPENLSAQKERTQVDKALQGRAAGVIVDNYSKTFRSATQSKNLITGRVIETDNGLPLKGATVVVAGTNVSTHTNFDGYFTISADSTKDKLYIANIGYQPRQVSTKNRDSLGKIALEPNNSSLSEVVVIGYGSKKTDGDALATSAHPDSGWSGFNKYLKKNAVSPDGNTGVVKLSFNVSGNGLISDVIVTKGLNKVDDQKAIDLINNGPAWIGNTNGMPEKVSVRIKFVRAR